MGRCQAQYLLGTNDGEHDWLYCSNPVGHLASLTIDEHLYVLIELCAAHAVLWNDRVASARRT